MDLKERLKVLIEERGITIASLSKKTEIPVQTLHNWLSGSEPRSLGQLKALADFFEVSVDFICFGTVVDNSIQTYRDEINAGVFEVVLRRIKK